jgi:hypothetical protein
MPGESLIPGPELAGVFARLTQIRKGGCEISFRTCYLCKSVFISGQVVARVLSTINLTTR